MDYGRAVRIVRAARGMTQAELAEKADVGPSYISQIESGQRTPSVSTINKLCVALRVPKPLLTLLASGSDELRNIDPVTAGVLGTEVLHLLMEVEKEQGDDDAS